MSILRKLTLSLALIVSGISMSPMAAHANTADDEAAFLADINALRASQGLADLCVNPDLAAVARAWAVHMAAANAISHNGALATQAPAGWSKLGENVGVGPDESALHTAFVNSPAHRRNLVDPSYTEAGIAVVESGGRKWVVQDFRASSGGSSAKPASAPRSVASNARSSLARAALAG